MRVDAYITADAPAQQRQFLIERCETSLKYGIVGGCRQKYRDAPDLFALLCGRPYGPSDR
jgi:hypothetical protein